MAAIQQTPSNERSHQRLRQSRVLHHHARFGAMGKDVQTTVAEIRKRYPDKKIIGYLWPQYYSASNSPYFKQFIDAGRWQKMLEISSKYMDGVIIWSDKRDENHQIVRWNDPRIQAIMRATKSFIAAHPKDIAVETLQPPTSSKSLKNSKLK